MEKQLSFSQVERELNSDFRNNLNNSEDQVDLANHFSFTVRKLLENVFDEENLMVENSDIVFAPGEKENFKLSPKLKNSNNFLEIWNNSDLENIISRFAKAVKHRHVHLSKHNEKTNKKIRR